MAPVGTVEKEAVAQVEGTTVGRVHSVETFGTVDGPGMRYVLFLQGCPLRCRFCHNRDTWERSGGRDMSVEEVISDIEKYIDFYHRTGGGVTASGGEPVLQAEFVAELFGRVKDLGLNTALDTSGYTDPERVAPLLNVTDLVLLDIKAVDPDKHRELTGVPNDMILAFARHLAEMHKPVWIRYVLIPGINNSPDDLQALANLLKDMKNIERVELLGYHKLGVHKWELCGEHDPLENVPPATREDAAKAREILKSFGVSNVY